MKDVPLKKWPLALILFLTVLVGEQALSQTAPPLNNCQGKLVSSNGQPVSTGDYELHFRIWDAATSGSLVLAPQVFNGQSGPGFAVAFDSQY